MQGSAIFAYRTTTESNVNVVAGYTTLQGLHACQIIGSMETLIKMY